MSEETNALPLLEALVVYLPPQGLVPEKTMEGRLLLAYGALLEIFPGLETSLRMLSSAYVHSTEPTPIDIPPVIPDCPGHIISLATIAPTDDARNIMIKTRYGVEEYLRCNECKPEEPVWLIYYVGTTYHVEDYGPMENLTKMCGI